jgi:hypothetical protein
VISFPSQQTADVEPDDDDDDRDSPEHQSSCNLLDSGTVISSLHEKSEYTIISRF